MAFEIQQIDGRPYFQTYQLVLNIEAETHGYSLAPWFYNEENPGGVSHPTLVLDRERGRSGPSPLPGDDGPGLVTDFAGSVPRRGRRTLQSLPAGRI